MTDEFEKALHRALRPRHPGEEFAARVTARLDANEARLDTNETHLDSHDVTLDRASESASGRDVLRHGDLRHRALLRHRAFRPRWFPAALAACLIAVIGVMQLRQHAVNAARAEQARAQLLQALSIASRNVNIVRAAVSREENPDS